MKRINEFEKLLVEKVNFLEQQNKVKIADFDRQLSIDGEIRYRYASALLGADITAEYKGSACYGKEAINLKLSVEFWNYNRMKTEKIKKIIQHNIKGDNIQGDTVTVNKSQTDKLLDLIKIKNE
jgi:hypothetical protein